MTERPPVIRERLTAYAKLFDPYPTGWHLLWVTNSPERLARLRQIAGPMKLSALAGRCWGVPVGEVSELGANAEVLAVGASQAPRPLREIATDPKARRTSYPVGSPAWVRLLANGGREDVAWLWHGVERRPIESVDASAPQRPMPNMTEGADSAVVPSQPTSRASEPSEPVAVATPAQADDDADFISPDKLVGLILDSGTDLNRLRQAGELLAEREEWPRVLYLLEYLCGSLQPGRQLLGIELVVRFYVAANDVFRLRLHPRLVGLADRGHQPNVTQAARAALEALPSPKNLGH